jgi:hypothetical protein
MKPHPRRGSIPVTAAGFAEAERGSDDSRTVKRRVVADLFLEAVGTPLTLVLIVGGLFALVARHAATAPVDDLDVWWIAAAGRDMLASAAIPRTNVYSYTAPEWPWVMHELGFGLLYALGSAALGPSFFPLLTVVAAAAAVSIAAVAIVGRTRVAPSAGIALLIVVIGCREGLFAPRPSHTALVFPLAMIAVAFRPGWSAARTVAVAALEILWANFHGSFPLGVAIVAASAFDDDVESRGARLTAAAIAAIATLVNPYGLRLHGLVGAYAFGGDPASRIIHEHIVEFFPVWRAPTAVSPMNGGALLTVAALALRALVSRRNVARAVLASMLVAFAAYQIRHVVLAVAVGAVLLHAEIDELFAAEGVLPKSLPRWIAAAIVLPALATGLVSWSAARAARRDVEWIATPTGGPPFARLVAAIPSEAHVYVPFESAGLAIWLGAGRGVRVFFDSRNDCYPPAVAEAAFSLERDDDPVSVAKQLERYGTGLALVPASHPVYAALQDSPSWTQSASDGAWHIFRRTNGRITDRD